MMPPPVGADAVRRLAARAEVDPRLLVLLRADGRRPRVPRHRPVTTLENKLLVDRHRHRPHRPIYVAIATLRAAARRIRRKAVVAGVASVVASCAWAATLDRRSKT